jgi:hypothetical protein
MERDDIDDYSAITEALLDLLAHLLQVHAQIFVLLITTYSSFAISAPVRTPRSFTVYAAVF